MVCKMSGNIQDLWNHVQESNYFSDYHLKQSLTRRSSKRLDAVIAPLHMPVKVIKERMSV